MIFYWISWGNSMINAGSITGSKSSGVPWKPCYAERMRGVQASEIRELLKIVEQPGMISFAGGIPDPTLFPTEQIKAAYNAILSDSTEASKALQYSVSEGDAELRSWIAGHMRSKGILCDVEHILITNGSQQALEFLGKLFISPGDRVAVTAPTYLGALQAFSPSQPEYATLHISEDGSVALEGGDTDSEDIHDALVYVVPDFANPTGETLSEVERRGILELAAERGMLVIEDSPYEMLRFDGIPELPLQALDIDGSGGIDASRVVYCGSFSKVFVPGLRVGWVCASREIISRLTLIKQSSDLSSPAINQRVMLHLARTIYDEQVVRACSTYRKKRDVMLSLIGEVMPADSRWTHPDGGMFIWVKLASKIDTRELLEVAARDFGVAFVPGQAFYVNNKGRDMLRLSYTLPSTDEIEIGLQRLGKAILAMS